MYERRRSGLERGAASRQRSFELDIDKSGHDGEMRRGDRADKEQEQGKVECTDVSYEWGRSAQHCESNIARSETDTEIIWRVREGTKDELNRSKNAREPKAI